MAIVRAAAHTLAVPNLSDSYADRVTRHFDQAPRRNWLAGCARGSTLGLFWGTGDRAVLCPARWEEPIIGDLERALGLRVLVHRMPEDLTPDRAGLDHLARRLRAFDGGSGFRIVAWAATDRLSGLVTGLVNRGVMIAASGSPVSRHWSDDYLNSKIGLRHLVQRAGLPTGIRMPPAVVCSDVEQACEAAASLLRGGHARVVLKADRGVGGFGQFQVNSGVLDWDPRKRAALARVAPMITPLLGTSPILAEAWIEHSPEFHATPSVMLEVGDHGAELIGTAATFMELGMAHAGAVVGLGAVPAHLDRSMAELGHTVAELARSVGYRGPIGLDAVVDREGRLYLLEVNARRTMVSHCYDLRAILFGPACDGAVASCESVRVRRTEFDCYQSVRRQVEDMWFRPESRSGVLITHFVPATDQEQTARVSLVAIDRDAPAAIALLRGALVRLDVDLPAAIESERSRACGGSR